MFTFTFIRIFWWNFRKFSDKSSWFGLLLKQKEPGWETHVEKWSMNSTLQFLFSHDLRFQTRYIHVRWFDNSEETEIKWNWTPILLELWHGKAEENSNHGYWISIMCHVTMRGKGQKFSCWKLQWSTGWHKSVQPTE